MAPKPPTTAIGKRADAPKAHSAGDPLSSSIDLLKLLDRAGLMLAPASPDSSLVAAAARQSAITPKQALRAFMIIAGHGESGLH